MQSDSSTNAGDQWTCLWQQKRFLLHVSFSKCEITMGMILKAMPINAPLSFHKCRRTRGMVIKATQTHVIFILFASVKKRRAGSSKQYNPMLHYPLTCVSGKETWLREKHKPRHPYPSTIVGEQEAVFVSTQYKPVLLLFFYECEKTMGMLI